MQSSFLFVDEPANVSFGELETSNEIMAQDMREVLKHGVSLVAEDPKKGNKIIGIRTAYVKER